MTAVVKLFQVFFHFVASGLFRWWFKQEIAVTKNDIPDNKPLLLVATHQSVLDTFIIFASFTTAAFKQVAPIYALVSEDYIEKKWQQRVAKLFGVIPFNKETENGVAALYSAVDVLADKKSLLLFPEGYFVKDQPLQPQPGVAYLWKKTDVSLLGFKIVGAHNLTLRQFLTRKRSFAVTPLAFGQWKTTMKSFREVSEQIMYDIYNADSTTNSPVSP